MKSRRITKVVIGVVVIGAATAYLLHQAIKSSWAYYYSVDEFVESPFYKIPQNNDAGASRFGGNRIIRLAGRVKDGSIARNVEEMQFDFELVGRKNTVAVRYYGVVPKNFSAGKEVIVEGRCGANAVFLAKKILTRCESKYKVRLKTQDRRLKPKTTKKPDKKE